MPLAVGQGLVVGTSFQGEFQAWMQVSLVEKARSLRQDLATSNLHHSDFESAREAPLRLFVCVDLVTNLMTQ